MASLTDELAQSIRKDRSARNMQGWARSLIEQEVPLKDLLPILDMDRKTATYFTWLVGGLCDMKPEVVAPNVAYFFSRRHDLKILNYDRSLAKMLWLAGVPEDIEGEAIDEMFRWLMDPEIKVATKVYAISAIYELSKKHPELRNELRLVIEDQLDRCSIAFQIRASKVLRDMDKLDKLDTQGVQRGR